ncbi:MAG TPA: septum formation initiator family protein [Firmicutes bacterium]|nr:septum formation initiator family protein [Bacillota bacterium]
MAKKKWRPNVKQFFLTLVLVAIMSWSILNIFATQKEVRKLNKELQRITLSISNVQDKQKEIYQEIEKWKDPEIIEAVARKELGFVRPGETTYMFSESVQPANETEVTERKGASREGIGN